MILSDAQILELLKKPLNGNAVTAGVTLQNEHKVHITGEEYLKLINQIEGFESGTEFNIRKQISKPATIQITSIILDNLNRWVNAQGTVKRVDFRDSSKNKAFDEVLGQVWNGKSFDEFIKTFYKEAIYIEFNGFVLITKPKIYEGAIIDKQGILSEYDGGSLMPYLIFISASDVHDFLLSGDKVEYLIISIDKNKKKYRIIDDAKDMVVTLHNEKISEVDIVKNEIGYVPAIKITNINKTLLSSQVKTSPIDHIIPALDRYFSADADLRIQFIRHAYPKLAVVTRECKICGGTGKVYKDVGGTMDMNTQVKCNTCDGSGKEIPISRDGVIGIPQYLQSGDTPYPGSPASYINPETESLRICIEDLEKQRKDILYSGTGDKGLISDSIREETATSTMTSSRSLEDRISEISSMVESFEIFCKKAIKDMHKDFAPISDYSITVKYGRRVTMKGETELIEEIKQSKLAGMPSSYIQALQKDLIYAKYKNNDNELQRQIILADVEPFCGYSIDELLKLGSLLNQDDLYLKVNFDALVDLFEENNVIQYYKPELDYKQRVNLIKQELLKYKPDAVLQGQTG